MTKQEIIDKINAGIRGQGSQVDIGGVLGDILEAILDLTGAAKTFDTPRFKIESTELLSRDEMAQHLGIDADIMDAIIDGYVPMVENENTRTTSLVITSLSDRARYAYFLSADVYEGPYLLTMSLSRTNDGKYQIQEF